MSSVAQSRPLGENTSEAKASPLLTVRLLRALGNLAERHGWFLFAAISLACGMGVFENNLVTRHLDHDELFTFYIAQAPSLGQSIKISQTVDLQPPLSYLLVRVSFSIFGVSAWSCRLPFLLAYACSTALLFYFVGRLVSPLYGLIATLLLWSTPYTSLATEARPYAILLCFTALTLVMWYAAAARIIPLVAGQDSWPWRWPDSACSYPMYSGYWFMVRFWGRRSSANGFEEDPIGACGQRCWRRFSRL